MKINKHRRLSKIIDVLEKWAPIESGEVAQHLSHIFNVEESEIKRNVVNDLKFLRDEGEVSSLFYDKHGKLISKEVEPEGVFYRVKWQLSSSEDLRISGSKEVQKFDVFIEADDFLAEDIRIRQGLGQTLTSSHSFTLYFEVNHEVYHLTLPKEPERKEGLPVLGIAIARTKNTYPKDLRKDFELLKSSYPAIPFILISFNEPFLSSFEINSPLTLLLSHDGKTTFFNEVNKNPVEVLEIPSSQATNLLSYLNFFRDKTQTRHWTDLKKENGNEYQTGDQDNLNLPILFRLKESSGFLLK